MNGYPVFDIDNDIDHQYDQFSMPKYVKVSLRDAATRPDVKVRSVIIEIHDGFKLTQTNYFCEKGICTGKLETLPGFKEPNEINEWFSDVL